MAEPRCEEPQHGSPASRRVTIKVSVDDDDPAEPSERRKPRGRSLFPNAFQTFVANPGRSSMARSLHKGPLTQSNKRLDQADRAVVMLEMLVLAIGGIGGLAWLIVLLASSRANSEAVPPLAGAVGASLVLAFTHCWRSPLALARTRKKERERIEVLERRLSRALNPDSDASTEISVSLADLGGLTSAHEQYQIDVPMPIRIAEADAGKPHISIIKALKHYAYDHTAATRAATRLRDADYTLHAFYADILEAFPEMRLYLAEREAAPDGENSSRLTVTSGISARDEYLRTIGAMFALYWLARIGIDGERGWSFGVDDDWAPRHPDGPMPDHSELRRKFYETTEWARLQQLLIDAGMLRRTAGGDVEVDVEVARSALALTAIHDIMKAEALLPTVSPEHASRCGFDAGDTINDHDIALAYLLDYHAHVLPSFAALSPAEQRSVRFTQSKMSFNHGWLVQAEAPPGALFGKFKQVVMDGEVQSRDIAFYFLHWLTDLAGATPTPLDGCEKFVVGFPHAVLGSFVRSFALLHQLATSTETEVFESYLVLRWNEAPYLGPPPPASLGAIALMRLVVQAQDEAKQKAIVAAFNAIPAEDRTVLSHEMARTGVIGQGYKLSSPPAGGPSILVYYSPAFVRSLTPDTAVDALQLLAEIYRRSRALWPLEPHPPGGGNLHTVTVRIDQVRELTLSDIQSVYMFGDSWLLHRRNKLEAVVERQSLDKTAEMLPNRDEVQLLKFWRLRATSGDAASDLADRLRGSMLKAVARAFASSRKLGGPHGTTGGSAGGSSGGSLGGSFNQKGVASASSSDGRPISESPTACSTGSTCSD